MSDTQMPGAAPEVLPGDAGSASLSTSAGVVREAHAAYLEYNQNDTLPSLYATLAAPDGTPLDLTDAQVSLFMRKRWVASFVGREIACTIVDPLSNEVQVDWATTDLSSAGLYTCAFRVTFANGQILTCLADTLLRVIPQIALST